MSSLVVTTLGATPEKKPGRMQKGLREAIGIGTEAQPWSTEARHVSYT
jgi:hypothetical protein